MPRESFRSFSLELEKLAGEWAKTAVTGDGWTDLGFYGTTESKPFKVSLGNLVGLAKPGKKTENICRAAHEKIASDLAFGLKLPIPPVVLWDMGAAVMADRERFVAISAWASPQASPWGQISASLTNEQKNETSQVMSAMLAFETWVSCNDRKDDHVLAYVPAPGAHLQLAFIDYAFSMSYHWTVPDDPIGASGPYLPLQRDVDSLRTMADGILQFEDEKAKTIIERIPEQFLPNEKKQIIVGNLIGRKKKLRGLLGL